jgi:hypothetical protein
MNERIRELVTQAGFRVFGDKIIAADQGSSGLATECAQRLIELIVKECIQECKSVGELAELTNFGEMARKTKATAESCAKLIMTSFGVK